MFSDRTLLEGCSPERAVAVILAYVLLVTAGTVIAVALSARVLTRPLPWGLMAARLIERVLTPREGLVALAGLLALAGVGFGLVASLRRAPESVLLLAQGLVFDGGGVLLLAVYLRRRGRTWANTFGLDRRRFASSTGLAVIAYLAMVPVLVFSSVVYQGILSTYGYPPSLQDVALVLSQPYGPWTRVAMAAVAVILAPVFEECVFRGIGLPLLARWLGMGPAILLTSLAFAAIHVHLPSLLPLLVIAVGFSLAYVYAGSLWVPITMHALFNAVNLGLLMWARGG